MRIVGLTGSIGMGKSTTSHMFRQKGVPVFDADKAVHTLYAKGGAAVPLIFKLYPDAVQHGAVHRPTLSKYILGNDSALHQIEQIIHPLVDQLRHRMLLIASYQKKSYVVLDVPLLFETGLHWCCDDICVVSTARSIQNRRVLGRKHMTVQKMQHILSRQVPDSVKRLLSTVIIPTSSGKGSVWQQITQLDRQYKHPISGGCWRAGGLHARPKTGHKVFLLRKTSYA